MGFGLFKMSRCACLIAPMPFEPCIDNLWFPSLLAKQLGKEEGASRNPAGLEVQENVSGRVGRLHVLGRFSHCAPPQILPRQMDQRAALCGALHHLGHTCPCGKPTWHSTPAWHRCFSKRGARLWLQWQWHSPSATMSTSERLEFLHKYCPWQLSTSCAKLGIEA
jgi:hypothetical protein